jgi:DNA-binding NtrC family response regulator/tetratricopeptide (TPR) repeat protein
MPSKKVKGKDPIDDAIAAGCLALEQTRFEDAVNQFRLALRLGPRSAEEEALIRCWLSEALEKRSLYREQLEIVSRYEKTTEFKKLSESSQMLVLIRLGWGYSLNNDIPRAIASFNQAMQIAERLEDHSGMGACCSGLGRAYRNFLEVRIARDHYISALKHYRRTGDWRKLAESYIHIGYINAYEGDYRSAISSLSQSLAIIGDKDEHDLLGRTLMYMAITYDHLGSTGKAIASWEKCIDHFARAGNVSYLAINQNNLADKLVWLGEWERAEQLLNQAIEVLKNRSVVNYGGALDTMAQLYLLQGKVDEADKLLDESLQILHSTKAGEWAEVSTRTTLGRSCLVKSQPLEAVDHLNRAVEICLRSGEGRLVYSAQLWLAEALIQLGERDRAHEIVASVRTMLQDAPNMLSWGFMVRMQAKMEAGEGHLGAAIQSLAQSTSSFEIRENPYECAVNQVLLATLLQRQRRFDEAVNEVKSAITHFERLGSTLDASRARQYLGDLEQAALATKQGAFESIRLTTNELSADRIGTVPSGHNDVDLASVVDGFTINRLVQAAASKDLLLHEMASVVKDRARATGALVAQIDSEHIPTRPPSGVRLVTSVGLEAANLKRELDLISEMLPSTYRLSFVYEFSDNNLCSYLLKVVGPESPRFIANQVTLVPLLQLVEQGLESQILKSRDRRTQVYDATRLLSNGDLPGFICASRAMNRVLEQINKIRSSDVTVLITGESGTGKELIARAIHAGSSRRYKTFLPFNCSAAPRELVESQLFGYKKGAFTGAVENHTGIVRTAERGTLFLDEIGDLPIDLQPKLLRFLQEGEVLPMGENQPMQVDVRILAATNSDLEKAVAEGKFREDLFHRLNVIRIQVPPLRERREEIPALIDYYLHTYQQEAAKSDIRLSEEAVDLMVVYDWPGNVRQLCNEVRRLVAYTDSGSIATSDDLSPEIVHATVEVPVVEPTPEKALSAAAASAGSTLAEAVGDLERRMITDALQRSRGNIARAAKQLGLSRRGLYNKMDRLNFKN